MSRLHVGRDYSNIEIEGRGFDLELFQGRKNPSNLASAVRPFTVINFIASFKTESLRQSNFEKKNLKLFLQLVQTISVRLWNRVLS